MEKNNRTTYPPITPSPNLTTSEAAQFLNLQPATLEQWRWNGRGPSFVKIGRACRYRRVDLETFLEDRIFSSTTEAQKARGIKR
jgi:excisionase family DNA binding protein